MISLMYVCVCSLIASLHHTPVRVSAGVPLDMDKTLEQNGVEDEDEAFYELRMDKDDYYPTIQLYYNDDLTDA